ncbi:MAG: chromosomal replication initiator protein DnaA [Alphaproteobacteria bacterium]|nr:chromosomal replication initiator protein DnaA [Alphaproteobacteria bacterium]
METLQTQWKDVCTRLEESLGEKVLNRWLNQIAPQGEDCGVVTLFVPTRFINEWIQKHYAEDILCAWQTFNPDITSLKFKIKPVEMSSSKQVDSIDSSFEDDTPLKNLTLEDKEEAPSKSETDEISTSLDPRFSFENFVVGKPNEFAYTAAQRVAESQDVAFNPLYLHGGVGLGKTHLMQAIAWRIHELAPHRKVLYLSAEKFMYYFVKALRYQETFSFRDLFRSVDVLMIDDVQFLCSKKATQEEFFHTFNALVDQGKQIILTADSSPVDLKGIESRLKTRMGCGLVVDIYPTTYELRLGILQSKAQMMNTNVPKEVIEFLAEHISTNVRELEGALRRVIAHAQLIGRPISLESTQDLLKDLLGACERRATVEEIQKKVAEHYNLKVIDLKSARRERKIARPRQVAMYLSKTMTTKSLPEIGLKFDRDHTTVIHAIKTIEKLLKEDANIAEDVRILKRTLTI